MLSKSFLILFSLFFLVLSVNAQNETSIEIRKVVIDAGHGGRDPGAVSANGKVFEKDITLSVALLLGNMIKLNYPYVDVIYTRDSDIFVRLDKRSEIANKSKADLFISIHVNAAKSRAASGSETFVMGADKTNSNLEVTMLENSVILLEGEDYKSRYEGFNPNDPESYIIFSLLQNAHIEQSLTLASLIQQQLGQGPIRINRGIKQAPLVVLWRTSMPSVLVELGFISNINDLKIMSEKRNQEKFANLIFNAFVQYKNKYDKNYSNAIDHNLRNNNETIKSSIVDSSNNIVSNPQHNKSQTIHYRIQILSVNKEISTKSREFKGHRDINHIKQGNTYKYTLGQYNSIEEARVNLREIRKTFPQAFIIKVENNKIVPL